MDIINLEFPKSHVNDFCFNLNVGYIKVVDKYNKNLNVITFPISYPFKVEEQQADI